MRVPSFPVIFIVIESRIANAILDSMTIKIEIVQRSEGVKLQIYPVIHTAEVAQRHQKFFAAGIYYLSAT